MIMKKEFLSFFLKVLIYAWLLILGIYALTSCSSSHNVEEIDCLNQSERTILTIFCILLLKSRKTLSFGHYQDLKQIEVIGNIYDNPELVGDENNV